MSLTRDGLKGKGNINPFSVPVNEKILERNKSLFVLLTNIEILVACLYNIVPHAL